MKTKITGVKEEIIEEKLDNGLRVFLLPNNKVKNYYITFNTKFGSRTTKYAFENEKKYTTLHNGVAHFLEHLTFNLEDGGDASLIFADLGSDVNAYTSFDVTCYEVFGFDKFKENLENLLDFVQTPCYTKEMVQNEKGIICEEIKMYEDNPNTKLVYGLFNNLVHKDNIKNLIAGSIKDVNDTTLTDITNAYNAFYQPNNMFVIITGNFNPSEALAIIHENQAKKEFMKPKKVIVPKVKELVSVVKDYEEIEDEVEIDKVNIGLKIPMSVFKSLKLDEQTLRVYINIITNVLFGRTSIIKDELIRGNIITDGLYVDRIYIDNYLIITIGAETLYKSRYISLMKEYLNNIEIEEEDIIRKKRVAISNFICAFDSIDMINASIQRDILDYDNFNKNIYDIYNNLDVKIAKQVMSKITMKNSSIFVLKSKNKEKN